MVTMNWYYVFKSSRGECVLSNVMKTWSGNTMNAGYAVSSSNQGIVNDTLLLKQDNVSFSETGTGIVLGSGTTPPTLHDYRLVSLITSGLTPTVSMTYDEEENLVYKITLTSTASEPISIGEIGIRAGFYAGSNSGLNYALMERTVLDEPVTIPAGGVGIVEYAIRMQMPEA